jgi:hypothetical protein
MKKIVSILLVFAIFLLSFPGGAKAETTEDPYEALLRAGKPRPGVNNVVGGVQVWNDAETLYVQFETDEPYCISALHLQIGNDLSSVPDADGNPDNGRAAINETYTDCLDVRGPFEYDIAANGWGDGSYLVIAAHVTVGDLECTLECETIASAPYGPYQVVATEQGLRKDGTPVMDARSNPDAVLIWDEVQTASGFYSLGLGGWIEVEFDNPITNVEGVDDVILVEDTWGTYVDEAAEVYASNDGVTWTLLGEANNENRDDVYTWQTTSTFDLGDLESARFIRVVDTTPVETMPPDGDGYDLNSIQALNDYEECTEVCTVCNFQRAWAGAKLDPGAAWSRWFRYLVTIAGEVISQEELPGAVWPGNDEIAAPGQSDEAGVGQPSNEAPQFQHGNQDR